MVNALVFTDRIILWCSAIRNLSRGRHAGSLDQPPQVIMTPWLGLQLEGLQTFPIGVIEQE